jgi:hypothetical protein
VTAWRARSTGRCRYESVRVLHRGVLTAALLLSRPCRFELCIVACIHVGQPPEQYGRGRRTVSTTSAKLSNHRSRSSTARSLWSTSRDGNAWNRLSGAGIPFITIRAVAFLYCPRPRGAQSRRRLAGRPNASIACSNEDKCMTIKRSVRMTGVRARPSFCSGRFLCCRQGGLRTRHTGRGDRRLTSINLPPRLRQLP